MRSLRICYFTAMVVLLIAGRLTGRREFFLLLFMMVFVVVYSAALNLWSIFSFSFLQEVSGYKAVKGHTLNLKIGIYNDKPFPFTMMRIRVETALPSENTVLGFNLPPQSHIYYDLPLYCAYRGVYKVGITTTEVNDIFGLIRIKYDMRSLPYYRQREITIMPRLNVPLFLPASIRDAKFAGGGIYKPADGGDSYAGLRQYRPGDSLTRLNWPASARLRDLFVKTYDRPSEASVLVAIDNSAAFDGEDALRYADLACECAAAIAGYGLQAGFAINVVEADESRPVTEIRGQREFLNFYESLATLPFGACGDLASNIRGYVRTGGVPRTVYALTTNQDVELCRALTELTRAGSSVKCFFLSPNGGEVRPRYNEGLLPGVSCYAVSFGEDVAVALNMEDVS